MKSRNSTLRSNSRLGLRLVMAIATVLSLASAHAQNVKTVSSTIPANGDINPYGVAVVPSSTGMLTKGDILVSNFNNTKNLQGTGTTIVQISQQGEFHLFAQIDPTKLPGRCPGGVGLTTALVALRSGWVIVGSLPTKDGMADTAKAGCLLVLNSKGQVMETFADKQINGPWDMTAADFGERAALFVTNVLNGTVKGNGKIVHGGTVLRLDLTISGDSMPRLERITEIGSGFAERTDPTALVIGPTGVGLSLDSLANPHSQVLYVADSLNNRIAAISDPLHRQDSAQTGKTVTEGKAINDPLGLTVAPNGDILSVNGANGFLVRTRNGQQVSKVLLDKMGHPPGAGALFGLTVIAGKGIFFVDDNENALNVLQ